MEEKILDILAEVCEDDVVKEDMSLDLFDEGLLDSLGVAQLFMELEDNLGIVIALTEVEKDDIRTPQQIVEIAMSRAEER